MGKVVFVIPGYGEKKSSRRAYAHIENAFKKRGYKTFVAPVTWLRHTMSDYVVEFVTFARSKIKRGDRIVMQGFSFGAVIALMSAHEIMTNNLLLCSLSPFFKQDLAATRRTWKSADKVMGKARMKDLARLDFGRFTKPGGRVTLLLGAKEVGTVEQRVKDAHKRIKGSKLVVIPGAKHDIGNPDYLTAIKSEIFSL